MMTRMPNVTCEIRPPSRRAGMRPYGLAPAGAAAPAARMVMSIWRCSLLDQYFELETGSRGAARSPPCAPETGGQPVNFHVTDCVSESEIGVPLWSFAGVKRTLDRKMRHAGSPSGTLCPEQRRVGEEGGLRVGLGGGRINK